MPALIRSVVVLVLTVLTSHPPTLYTVVLVTITVSYDAAMSGAVYGGTGDDLVNITGASNAAAASWNVIYGNDGNDTVTGSLATTGQIIAYGGSGNDLLYGGNATQDIIYGGEGADTIYALGTGADVVYGDAGADVLYGGMSGGTVFGGEGNDTIWDAYGSGQSNAGLRRQHCPVVRVPMSSPLTL